MSNVPAARLDRAVARDARYAMIIVIDKPLSGTIISTAGEGWTSRVEKVKNLVK